MLAVISSSRKKFVRKISVSEKDFHFDERYTCSQGWGFRSSQESGETMANCVSCNKSLVIKALLLALALTVAGAKLSAAEDNSPKYLYICAGDQARTAPDFLAVINFDEKSVNYGKVIATAPLPQPGGTGNEFHHIGLSADGKVVACGGLLSVLKGQKEIFFFDVSDPDQPKFISSADPPLSGSG